VKNFGTKMRVGFRIRMSSVPRAFIIWLAPAVKVERSSTPRLHRNTLLQVIHGRPEVAPKASRREAVNNLAAAVAVEDSRPYCGWQPFCRGVATVGSTAPYEGFVKKTDDAGGSRSEV
jgi:hypothetical protein